MPLPFLLTTNTFRDWFNQYNNVVSTLNGTTLVAGIVANGAFTVNGSLLVQQTFFANASIVQLLGNTTIAANTTATANCNVFNFACGSVLLQPINGTIVNTAITINAVATFIGVATFGANVTVTGQLVQAGNTVINGLLTVNGAVQTRQVLYGTAASALAPAALTNPQYDDYAPAGIQDCAVLNLTPSIDTVITGIQAPVDANTLVRVLVIQNLSATFNITLPSANTSSGVNNRFKLPSDLSITIPPGGLVEIVYSTATHQWRSTSLSNTLVPTLTVLGNTNISGKLVVTNTASFGNTTINGWLNVASTLQVAGVSALQGNTDVTGYANISLTLQVAGLSTLTGNASLGGFANVAGTLQVAANTTLNGTRCFANGQFRCDTTNGRLVLPVGSNLWAT